MELKRDMIDDGLNPHTCTFCEFLVLSTASEDCNYEVTLSHMFSASESGCDLFKWCLHQLDPAWGRPRDGRTWKSAVESAGQMDTAMLFITFRIKDKELQIQPGCNAPLPIGRGTDTRPFTVLAREGDPAAPYFRARPINKIVRSRKGIFNEEIKNRYHKWHELPTAKAIQFPSRLIDLGQDESLLNLMLMDVDPGWFGSYAALSYCWGGPQTMCTTLESLTIRRQGISYDSLPKTLQDACFVTRKLDIQYLWIDALCIIQDSEKDLNHEIAKMRDIYRGSAVTIVASRASNVHQGFLNDRVVNYGQSFQLPYRGEDATQPGTIIFCKQTTAQDVVSSDPLDTRAWALQERLLSPRIIEFGNIQTTWRFDDTIRTDGGWSTDDLRTHNLGKVTQFMLHSYNISGQGNTKSEPVSEVKKAQIWSVIVQEYTSRNLTIPSDRLLAISGLADSYEAFLGLDSPTKYLAGLWEHHLPEGLLWRRSVFPSPFNDGNRHCQRDVSIAPSWSWASINGKISIPHSPNVGCQKISTIVVSASVELVDIGNRVGRVKYGKLVLKGPVFKARYNPAEPKGLIVPELDNKRFGNLSVDVWADSQSGDMEVWCIEICVRHCTGVFMHLIDRRLAEVGVGEGLILAATGEDNIFRRIGSYCADLRSGDIKWDEYVRWVEAWEERAIIVV